MLKSITYILMLIGLTFLFTLFILIYRRQLVRFIIMCFADKHKAVVMDVVNSIQYMVKKYLIGLIIQMVLVTILSFIAYTIIGIKYNFLLAIITGIFNVLPYLHLNSYCIRCFCDFCHLFSCQCTMGFSRYGCRTCSRRKHYHA